MLRDAAEAAPPIEPPPPVADGGGGGGSDGGLPSVDVSRSNDAFNDVSAADRAVADQTDRAVPDIVTADVLADAGPPRLDGWGCAVMKNVLVFSAITNGEAGESNPPSVSMAAPQFGSRYRIQTAGTATISTACCRAAVTKSRGPTPAIRAAPGLRSYAAASTFT
ncbi:MAG TPA: hypothetical protein VK550_14380 [Polyangiaceae bacterium]|nr:hypothetical protein [Polyangiaceae bacterium]